MALTTTRIINGDARAALATLDSASVNCCVTSPPYWGLRAYDGQERMIGMEESWEQYLESILEVLHEVRRVLRNDGTLWLNLGDAYAGSKGSGGKTAKQLTSKGSYHAGVKGFCTIGRLPAKSLLMMPARVCIALQDLGWILRSKIVWRKPNAMVTSAKDRPTCSYEEVFLFSKRGKYQYDASAIAETAKHRGRIVRYDGTQKSVGHENRTYPGADGKTREIAVLKTRNARDVWTISKATCKEAHFAVMPDELARKCVTAGCPDGGTVLDPFGGTGTTAVVAGKLGRSSILVEISPKYVAMAHARVAGTASLLNEVTVETLA